MRPPIPAEELAVALALLQDGASYHEVGRTLGRADSAIRRYFPGYGWTQAQGWEFMKLQQRLEEVGRR